MKHACMFSAPGFLPNLDIFRAGAGLSRFPLSELKHTKFSKLVIKMLIPDQSTCISWKTLGNVKRCSLFIATSQFDVICKSTIP
jgi:hypothetical protein